MLCHSFCHTGPVGLVPARVRVAKGASSVPALPLAHSSRGALNAPWAHMHERDGWAANFVYPSRRASGRGRETIQKYEGC